MSDNLKLTGKISRLGGGDLDIIRNNVSDVNAELANICVGYDGTTYASAGEAVRLQIGDLKGNIDKINEGGLNLKDEVIEEDISKWLSEHPEATTTVQDSSIIEPKIHPGFLPNIKNCYTTPEAFGAVGDGVTDDTDAMQLALDSNKIVVLTKNYVIAKTINMYNGTVIFGHNSTIINNSSDFAFDLDNDDFVGVGPVLYGIRIIGGNGIKIGSSKDNSKSKYIMRPVVQKCTITSDDVDSVGMQLNKCFDHMIEHNSISNQKMGLEMTACDLGVIRNNRFAGNDNSVVSYQVGTFGSQNTIKENDILSYKKEAIYTDERVIRIYNNYFESYTSNRATIDSNPIHVGDGVHYHVIIDGNRCETDIESNHIAVFENSNIKELIFTNNGRRSTYWGDVVKFKEFSIISAAEGGNIEFTTKITHSGNMNENGFPVESACNGDLITAGSWQNFFSSNSSGIFFSNRYAKCVGNRIIVKDGQNVQFCKSVKDDYYPVGRTKVNIAEIGITYDSGEYLIPTKGIYKIVSSGSFSSFESVIGCDGEIISDGTLIAEYIAPVWHGTGTISLYYKLMPNSSFDFVVRDQEKHIITKHISSGTGLSFDVADLVNASFYITNVTGTVLIEKISIDIS